MENSKSKYLTLFLSTLQLSAFTFGGGFVIIPLMRKKFVEKLHWLDEQEMMDFAAIAQSSPGAIAVNASILIGYRIAGLPGALVTVAGMCCRRLSSSRSSHSFMRPSAPTPSSAWPWRACRPGWRR